MQEGCERVLRLPPPRSAGPCHPTPRHYSGRFRGLRCRSQVGRRAVVTHFPAQAGREPNSNGCADINARRRTAPPQYSDSARSGAPRCQRTRYPLRYPTGDPRRDHRVGGELHAQRRYNKDRGQGYDGLGHLEDCTLLLGSATKGNSTNSEVLPRLSWRA